MIRRILTVLTVFAAFTAASGARAATITVPPAGGVISGIPGATVGWGFTIASDTYFVQVTNSEFCEGAQTPPCSSTLGTYTDYIATNFTVAGPAPETSPLTQVFDPLAMVGVGGFTLRPDAPVFTFVSGTLTITYDVYTVSPNDPLFDPFDPSQIVSTGETATANARIMVTPEPATFGLAGLALTALAAFRRRR